MKKSIVLTIAAALLAAGAYRRHSRESAPISLSAAEKQSLHDAAAELNDGELPQLRSQAKKLQDDGTFMVTIEKKPKEVVAEGPVLIYRYNMSGTNDYQWIYVPTEESRVFVVSLLKALKVIKGDSGVGVRTLAEVKAQKIVPGEHEDSHAQNIARLTADLRSHAAVVDSYENRAPAK